MSETTKEKWLYIGERQGKKVKTVVVFERLTLAGSRYERTGDVVAFGFKQRYAVGGLYDVSVTLKDGRPSISSQDLTFTGVWTRGDEYAALRAENELVKAQIEAERLEAKYKRGEALPDSLKECARVYRRLPYVSRRHFVSLVSAHIERLANCRD